MATRVELNIEGFNQLRNSSAVLADLQRRADAIAKAAGPGFKTEVASTKVRARVRVWADTEEAKHAEAKRAALTRAVDAGR